MSTTLGWGVCDLNFEVTLYTRYHTKLPHMIMYFLTTIDGRINLGGLVRSRHRGLLERVDRDSQLVCTNTVTIQ